MVLQTLSQRYVLHQMTPVDPWVDPADLRSQEASHDAPARPVMLCRKRLNTISMCGDADQAWKAPATASGQQYVLLQVLQGDDGCWILHAWWCVLEQAKVR